MSELLGASLALAALLSINAAATIAASVLWRLFSRYADRWNAGTRAGIVFALRVYPASASLVVAFAVVVPAYLYSEPPHTNESVGGWLAVAAALSIIGILLAVWRGAAAWTVTARLERNWLRSAKSVRLAGINLDAHVLKHSFPVVAILGVVRPRLFIAEHVLSTLTPRELSAAIAHERAHVRSRDNLKRIALRACRDVLSIIPCGRSLDRAWSAASEHAADARAAHHDPEVALDLASALVKISRLIPVHGNVMVPNGAYLIGDFEGSIESRVQTLLALGENDASFRADSGTIARAGLWCSGLIFLVATVAAVANPVLLLRIHALIEWVVSSLS